MPKTKPKPKATSKLSAKDTKVKTNTNAKNKSKPSATIKRGRHPKKILDDVDIDDISDVESVA